MTVPGQPGYTGKPNLKNKTKQNKKYVIVFFNVQKYIKRDREMVLWVQMVQVFAQRPDPSGKNQVL